MEFYWQCKTTTRNDFKSFGDTTYADIYQSLFEDNRLRVFFYGEIPSYECFYKKFNQVDCFYYAAYELETNHLLAFVAVTGITGYVGMMHFCATKYGQALAFDLAQNLFSFLLKDGAFEALYGLTPVCYRHAINFIKKIGFQEITRVPRACFVINKLGQEKCYDAILTQIRRA